MSVPTRSEESEEEKDAEIDVTQDVANMAHASNMEVCVCVFDCGWFYAPTIFGDI